MCVCVCVPGVKDDGLDCVYFLLFFFSSLLIFDVRGFLVLFVLCF